MGLSLEIDSSRQVKAIAFDPAGALLAGEDKSGHIRVWRVASGQPYRKFRPHEPDGRHLAFSPDGLTLGTVSTYDVELFDLRTGRSKAVYPCGSPLQFHFSPDGNSLVVHDGSEGLRTIRRGTGDEMSRVRWGETRLRTFATSADGKWGAGVGDTDKMFVFDLARGRLVHRFVTHSNNTFGLALNADGSRLVTTHDDGTALVWDLQPAREAAAQPLPGPPTTAQCWDALVDKDAAKAAAAATELTRRPKEAVELIASKLTPVPPPAVEQLAKWVAELDHASFDTRDRAEQGLRKLEELAGPALKDALKRNPSEQARKTIEQLLARIDAPVADHEKARRLRAVEILADIGTPEAKAVLTRLAAGDPEAFQTRDARLALRRIDAAATKTAYRPPGQR
jgi:hypothetical protein